MERRFPTTSSSSKIFDCHAGGPQRFSDFAEEKAKAAEPCVQFRRPLPFSRLAHLASPFMGNTECVPFYSLGPSLEAKGFKTPKSPLMVVPEVVSMSPVMVAEAPERKAAPTPFSGRLCVRRRANICFRVDVAEECDGSHIFAGDARLMLEGRAGNRHQDVDRMGGC